MDSMSNYELSEVLDLKKEIVELNKTILNFLSQTISVIEQYDPIKGQVTGYWVAGLLTSHDWIKAAKFADKDSALRAMEPLQNVMVGLRVTDHTICWNSPKEFFNSINKDYPKK